jgi:hypothetical protein
LVTGRDHADTGRVKRYPTMPLSLQLGFALVLIGAFGW